MINKDLVIIGGGSAGLAAAIQAKKDGINDILILEKDDKLGGILNQCIHAGFGLTEFKEELTGPEYYSRFVEELLSLGIEYKLNSFVMQITRDKVVTYTNDKDGVVEIKAKAIILAVGCFERNAGMIQLPGDRVSGIMTAGTAQKYLNVYGYLPGKKIVILGSGDIGLIMARRLTLEGAKVLCVSELMPYSNGLNRNIAQCLTDYNIPLYLSRSVSKVIGKSRVEKVVLTAVDEKMQFIPGTDMEIECDTLILSVGLLPYLALLMKLGPKMVRPGQLYVDDNLQVSIPGIFLCGNCLHVHDVVDFVSDEGRSAGHSASLYIKGELKETNEIEVVAGEGLSYIIPHSLSLDKEEQTTFKFRVRKPIKDVNVVFKNGDNIIHKVVKPVMIPSEMVMIKVDANKFNDIKEGKIEISLEERK